MISYLKKVKDYIQGYSRYHLYYIKKGKFRKWIPRYIVEQFEYRLGVMDHECLNNGSCKICGCDTTALQMANKACDKPCYPEMMKKSSWEIFKKVNNI